MDDPAITAPAVPRSRSAERFKVLSWNTDPQKLLRGSLMKTIKVLGPGCKKCKLLEQNVREAVAALHGDYEIEKIEDIEKMMQYNIMSSPGLVVDEKLVLSGRVASVDELKDILK
jgi:small redox-active disulfide protein 2